MGGCLDGCFGWTGRRCIGLSVEKPVEACKFYKTVTEAEKERLKILDAHMKAAERYERGNKRYWLMDISDEFLAVNADDLDRICVYRSLARAVARGDEDAVRRAREMLGR